MDIEKHTYVHLNMHEDEANKLKLMLEQIDHGASNLPSWVKAQSIEFLRKLNKALS